MRKCKAINLQSTSSLCQHASVKRKNTKEDSEIGRRQMRREKDNCLWKCPRKHTLSTVVPTTRQLWLGFSRWKHDKQINVCKHCLTALNCKSCSVRYQGGKTKKQPPQLFIHFKIRTLWPIQTIKPRAQRVNCLVCHMK